jgi:hypothetical protein
MSKLLLAVIAAAGVFAAWGDTLILKNGTRHTGAFVSGSSTSVVFRDEKGTRRSFPLETVDRIEFGSAATTGGFDSRDRERRTIKDSQTLPAGTEIQVRTSQAIDSESAAEGRTYAAVIERDVTDSTGAVVVPRGSEVELAVKQTTDAGTVREAEVVLDLRSVTISGKRYLLETAPVEQSAREGIGKNRRTAEMVGGGAALGSVIGAIAGGGKGALIGAIIGAAGGGAAQVFTRGKRVEVPSETVLTFKLAQPVRFEPVP